MDRAPVQRPARLERDAERGPLRRLRGARRLRSAPARLPRLARRLVCRASMETDTSGIRVPPPVYYVAGFLLGVALELAFPTSWPPAGIRIAVTVLAALAWFALDGLAMVSFSRAGTSMVPMNPTTALVTSGPYRFTRNPMYVGMGFLYVA